MLDSVPLKRAAIAILFSVIFAGPFSLRIQAQDGERIFETKCAVCHNLDDQPKVGPGLHGILERRDEDWLVKFIKNPQAMWDAGDEYALKILDDFKGVKMLANPDLEDEEIRAVIKYVSEYKPEEKPVVDLAAEDFTETDVKRGERLFRGLIPFEDSHITCSSCHNVNTIDSLNWSPSVFEIATVLFNYNKDLHKILNDPTSRVMKVAHANTSYTEQEAYYIKAYLHHVKEVGLHKSKKFPMKLMIFLGLGFLMTLVLIDLFFTKFVKFRLIHALILLGAISWQLKIVAHEAINLGRTKDYQPDQPIKFSHKIHADQNKIDCFYCHSDARSGKSAGIPSSNLCLNCHNVVREGPMSGKFEISKIHDAVRTGTPIEWIRVHNLPDHVYFNHSQHVTAGGIDCATCHGPIETMHIVKQYSNLSMGWCVNCHRDTKVQQFESNEYYSQYMGLHEQLKAGEIDSVTVEQIGGIDCMKCHY